MRDGCILMHFHTCCILDMLHSNAFSCIQKVRCMLMHSPRDAYVAWRIVMHFDAVVLAASLRIPNTVHSYVLLCICSALHSTWVAFKCICMPPHIRCILSTRCILTHSHSYAFKRIQMHSLTYAFTSVRRCIHSCMHTRVSIRMKTWMACSGTWVLHWHALWQNGTPTARPAHTRPCEFGLESARLLLCKYVWSLVYSGAFWRICMH
jgi:hypothetical protein